MRSLVAQVSRSITKIASAEPADYVAINLFSLVDSLVWKVALGAVYACFLVGTLAGRRSRLSLGAIFLLTVSYTHEFSEILILNGGDQLLLCMAFWLLVLPRTTVTNCSGQRDTLRLTMFVLQAQVALVYAATGLHKLNSSVWSQGEAINLALNSPFIRPWVSGFQVPFVASQVLSYATIAFELTFPVGVFVRTTRPLYLMCGILFHVVLEATLRLSMFSWIMVASYTLFLDNALAAGFLARFRRASANPTRPINSA